MTTSETDHIVCCDPATALCGAPVAGTAVSFELPDKAPNLCFECSVLEMASVKCLDPSCPGPPEDAP